MHDAEDLVQETYLRAWRAYHSFEGRSSVRTWLYRIATNVCLTALEGRRRRPMPAGLGAPSGDGTQPVEENGEIPWLEPFPDAVHETSDPLAVVTDRDSIRLAFVAALQHLPARQRAVLILRDVLRWQAAEVAEALETTTASVNSCLQRAHATLDKAQLSEDTVGEPDRRAAGDAGPLRAGLLGQGHRRDRLDADPGRGVGDAAVHRLVPGRREHRPAHRHPVPGRRHDMRMVPTRANGQPAFGLYMRGDDGEFHPFHLQVLTLGPDGVEHVGAFFGAELFATFGLPERLPPVSG